MLVCSAVSLSWPTIRVGGMLSLDFPTATVSFENRETREPLITRILISLCLFVCRLFFKFMPLRIIVAKTLLRLNDGTASGTISSLSMTHGGRSACSTVSADSVTVHFASARSAAHVIGSALGAQGGARMGSSVAVKRISVLVGDDTGAWEVIVCLATLRDLHATSLTAHLLRRSTVGAAWPLASFVSVACECGAHSDSLALDAVRVVVRLPSKMRLEMDGSDFGVTAVRTFLAELERVCAQTESRSMLRFRLRAVHVTFEDAARGVCGSAVLTLEMVDAASVENTSTLCATTCIVTLAGRVALRVLPTGCMPAFAAALEAGSASVNVGGVDVDIASAASALPIVHDVAAFITLLAFGQRARQARASLCIAKVSAAIVLERGITLRGTGCDMCVALDVSSTFSTGTCDVTAWRGSNTASLAWTSVEGTLRRIPPWGFEGVLCARRLRVLAGTLRAPVAVITTVLMRGNLRSSRVSVHLSAHAVAVDFKEATQRAAAGACDIALRLLQQTFPGAVAAPPVADCVLFQHQIITDWCALGSGGAARVAFVDDGNDNSVCAGIIRNLLDEGSLSLWKLSFHVTAATVTVGLNSSSSVCISAVAARGKFSQLSRTRPLNYSLESALPPLRAPCRTVRGFARGFSVFEAVGAGGGVLALSVSKIESAYLSTSPIAERRWPVVGDWCDGNDEMGAARFALRGEASVVVRGRALAFAEELMRCLSSTVSLLRSFQQNELAFSSGEGPLTTLVSIASIRARIRVEPEGVTYYAHSSMSPLGVSVSLPCIRGAGVLVEFRGIDIHFPRNVRAALVDAAGMHLDALASANAPESRILAFRAGAAAFETASGVANADNSDVPEPRSPARAAVESFGAHLAWSLLPPTLITTLVPAATAAVLLSGGLFVGAAFAAARAGAVARRRLVERERARERDAPPSLLNATQATSVTEDGFALL